MRVCIKKSWSRDDAKKFDGVCLTPDNFASIKLWDGVTVSGEKYYVDKAVALGAKELKKPGPKPKADQ